MSRYSTFYIATKKRARERNGETRHIPCFTFLCLMQRKLTTHTHSGGTTCSADWYAVEKHSCPLPPTHTTATHDHCNAAFTPIRAHAKPLEEYAIGRLEPRLTGPAPNAWHASIILLCVLGSDSNLFVIQACHLKEF